MSLSTTNDRLAQANDDSADVGYIIGTVTVNIDPLGLGRVKCSAPNIFDPSQGPIPWIGAHKKSPFGVGKGYGVYGSPAIGSQVRFKLQDGDVHYGLCEADEYSLANANAKFASPDTWGFKDPSGNELFVNMKSGDWQFTHSSGATFFYDKAGDRTQMIPKNAVTTIKGNEVVTITGTSTRTITGSETVAVTGSSNTTVKGSESTTVVGSSTTSSTGPMTIKSTTMTSVSSTAAVSVSAPMVKSAASALNQVSGSFVMMGAGALGNLSSLTGGAASLFSSVMLGGLGSIMSNPLSGSLGSLVGSISSTVSGLTSIPGILTSDVASLTSALSSPTGLLGAAGILGNHTDLLSGVTSLTGLTGNLPSLNGVIGISGGLDNIAGGAFGSATSLLPSMTTALTAVPSLTSINSYVNSIVPALTIGSITPATVLSDLSGHSSTLTSFVTADTAAFNTAQTQLQGASSFLGIVGQAQNPSAAVQSMMSQVTAPSTLAALQSIVPIGGI